MGLTDSVFSTNLRTPRIRGMDAMPVQQVLYPGMLDVSPCALQHGIVPCSGGFDPDPGLAMPSSMGIQRQQRCVSE